VTGKPVSPFTQRQINKDLQAHGATMHNEHVGWDYSRLPDTPRKGGAPSSLFPDVPATGVPQSDFAKAAGIDAKILNGHTRGVAGAKPLNSFNPLSGKWETNWYKGDTVRSFADPVKDASGKIVDFVRKGAGGS